MHRQSGVSLIELMIALVIAALLTLGMIQIFVGSKTAYQVQEGLSRIQENGRFSLQFVERNARLAGYMGCGSDIARVPPNNPTTANYPFDTRFINHRCDPNCEPQIRRGRVFIVATRAIRAGEELGFEYNIGREDDDPPNVDEIYACRCGARRCRGTILWPPKKPATARESRRA